MAALPKALAMNNFPLAGFFEPSPIFTATINLDSFDLERHANQQRVEELSGGMGGNSPSDHPAQLRSVLPGAPGAGIGDGNL
jgi:hypothetical protein